MFYGYVNPGDHILMYTIYFYETPSGESPLWDFMESLRIKSSTNKSARIFHKQFSLYIQLLTENGTNLPAIIAKHLEDDIWELRPGKHRILFFKYNDNSFVLLHHFRKKSQKTPRREITKAKREQSNWLARKETSNENME